jgi:hypothetical protein
MDVISLLIWLAVLVIVIVAAQAILNRVSIDPATRSIINVAVIAVIGIVAIIILLRLGGVGAVRL